MTAAVIGTTNDRQPGHTGYGVKLVRGPFLSLASHPGHVEPAALPRLCREMRSANPGVLLAADLFCGAGGLSLGLHEAGVEVVLAVDHDEEARLTHAHHFPGVTVDWDLGDVANV